MKLKYGIISTAGINQRFIGALKETNGTVIAVASRTMQKAEAYARKNGIDKAYGSYEELYLDKEIEIVYISTINSDHVSQIKKALSYGKHVLCEKPLALNKEDAIEVFALAKEKKLFLMEMQKSVFLPVTHLVKEYIDQDLLGRLHQVDMSACFLGTLADWMYDPKQGGVVYGSASYTIEYLDYLLNPKRITILPLATKKENGCIDSVSLNIKMDDVLINSRITMKAKANNFCVFYFENGYIEIGEYWKARSLTIYANDGKQQQNEYPITYEMQYEILHVEECLRNNMIESPIMNKERTIKCCEIVEDIIQLIG